jgi:uncharacterized repeat protein (TIGR03847 family)
MAGELVDFNPVSRITIGAVGQPGQRVFLLQANQGSHAITLKLEKEQAMVLATSTIELLEELEQKYPRQQSRFDKPLSSDLLLREPLEPAFAIGQIGLGYDQEHDLIVLVVQELPFEGLEKPATARFWASRAQMQALSDQTLEVASQGRPICPLCDSPMDPEGHFCPRSNGHEKPQWSQLSN